MKIAGRVLFLVLFAVVPLLGASAQSTPGIENGAPSAFSDGVGSTATYFDQRGNPILSITVTGIERNWQSLSRYSEPQAGMEYVLLSVSITNESNRPFIVETYSFSMVDSLGVSTTSAWVYDDVTVLSEDTTIDGGQTLETGLVFEMFTDLKPLLLMYEPDYDIFVVIHLGD